MPSSWHTCRGMCSSTRLRWPCCRSSSARSLQTLWPTSTRLSACSSSWKRPQARPRGQRRLPLSSGLSFIHSITHFYTCSTIVELQLSGRARLHTHGMSWLGQVFLPCPTMQKSSWPAAVGHQGATLQICCRQVVLCARQKPRSKQNTTINLGCVMLCCGKCSAVCAGLLSLPTPGLGSSCLPSWPSTGH